MNTLNISLDAGVGVTVLSNVFIDEYMCDANDAQIKVYLYLLRQVMSGGTTDISEMADIFNYTEKDILRSLTYWEKKGLLALAKNDDGETIGLSIKDINNNNVCAASSQATPVAREKIVSGKGTIAMISMDYAKEKQNYSLDDIKALSGKKEVKMLINAAGQYFGRPLNPEEIRTLLFIYDRLGFSFDMTDHLLDYCVGSGKASMHFAEQVAINWYEQGINTVEKAKATDKKPDKTAYAVMEALAKHYEPTAVELEYIKKWTGTYGFSLPIIEDACARTVLGTDKNRFQYADSILKSWYGAGVRDKKDIEALDAKHAEAKSTKIAITPAKAPEKKSNFCDIMQQDYDFDAIEAAIAKKILG